MENKDFVHLHVHNQFSVLDGFGSSEQYTKKAKELGFTHLALTNHGNVDGILAFQSACEKNDIKPIFGCEAYIVPDMLVKEKGERRAHINILVKNEEGWTNLLKMLTEANVYGFFYRPRLDYKTILSYDLSGLVFTTACAGSFLLLDGGVDFFEELQTKTEVYCEIMPHLIDVQEDIHDLIKELRIPKEQLILTNDCHYIEEDDDIVQEILLAVQTHRTWNDPDRWSFGFSGLHLRTADEMYDATMEQGHFNSEIIKTAMANTKIIAEKCCNFRIPQQEIFLPMPPMFEGKDENKELYKLCLKGLKRIKKSKDPDYLNRLEEEYELIKKKNFSRYFLIVYELINWCRKNKVLCGPGRGSSGGSLIAYLLHITSVDPLEYNLLFSRFINEERIDYPDIDIDFEDRKRGEVRKHLQDLYGEENIAGVSTFGTLKGKAAIRDVSRVFEIPYDDVDSFAKAIDYDEDGNSIDRAIKSTDEGKDFNTKYPDVVRYASRLEGQIRNCGQHASAVIVSAEPITNGKRANIVKRKGVEVINWSKDDAEFVGLMKLDILGLNTLSIIRGATDLIKENHSKIIDPEKIPLGDKKVFEWFSKGKTAGVFQFNTKGIIQLCGRIKPNKFEDLFAINALYRPGPLRSGMTDEYVERHISQEWEVKNPELKEITKDTYGIILMQEQVMQIMYYMAKLPWKEADKVRKIIGKSKGAAQLKKFKEAFVDGCVKNETMNKKNATQLWEDIESFGGYGFVKAHSVEYSMISYWCMWLKYMYPTEFISSSLTYGKDDKKEEVLVESYNLGLKISPPKIGLSDPFLWKARGKTLYCPFIEIKGIGEKKAKTIPTGLKKGFYNKDGKTESALGKLLKKIGAYEGDEIPDDISDYLAFDINQDPRRKYPNLYEFIGEEISNCDFDEIYSGEIGFDDGVLKKRYRNDDVISCEKCTLREECKAPILTSTGKYNIFILGEYPGWDDKNKPLSGDLGKDTVWYELGKFGLQRKLFHTAYLARCRPSQTKKPRTEHLNQCFKNLKFELKMAETRVVLGFGNTAVNALTDQVGGIMAKNATTEWNDKIGCWVCWCVSPFSAYYSEGDNPMFTEGIKNFVKTIRRFPVFDEICF